MAPLQPVPLLAVPLLLLLPLLQMTPLLLLQLLALAPLQPDPLLAVAPLQLLLFLGGGAAQLLLLLLLTGTAPLLATGRATMATLRRLWNTPVGFSRYYGTCCHVIEGENTIAASHQNVD